MAFRYRFRRAHGDETWSKGLRLREIMRKVRRRQVAEGGPFRKRRRDKEWERWWKRAWRFRRALNSHLRNGRIGVYQVQIGGADGPVYAISKFRLQPPELTDGEKVIGYGMSVLGAPYVFGEANGPEDPGTDKFDCSGLTQQAWASVGVFLPHSAELQRTAGNVVNFNAESSAKPGDLVFMWFPNSRGIPSNRASHVGLHVGTGETGMVLDTRNPINKPVGIRPADGVIGYGRPS